MKKFFLFLLILGLGAGGYGLLWVYRLKSLENAFYSYSYNKESQKVSYKKSPIAPKNWVRISKLNKGIYGAFVVSEDWSFFTHNGLDLYQLQKAIEEGLQGERMRGASTISQQLVKNLFLSFERSLWRKAKEAFLTLVMENYVSKLKILELYLNIIEFGEGIYGLSDASLYYFQKYPQDLNARESAFLAMLLPNPKRYAQSFRKGVMSRFATDVVGNILNNMRIAHFIDKSEYEEIKSVPYSWEQKREMGDQEEELIDFGEANYYELNQ